MRTIEDTPILTSGFLNSTIPGVFDPQETVELVPERLADDVTFHLWQVIPNSLQLSAPYLARVVRIASLHEAAPEQPVLTRELIFGRLGDG
jgi:hypothetical protein